MGKIIYDSEKIRNSASRISEKVTELETNIQRIDVICDEISASWTGSSCTSYINNLLEKKADLQKIVNKLKELPECLNKIAMSNDDVQSRIKAKLSGN